MLNISFIPLFVPILLLDVSVVKSQLFIFIVLVFSSQAIAFIETRLTSEILSSETFSERYTTYGLDQLGRRGGGVLIALDSIIASDLLQPEIQFDIELIYVNLHFPGVFLYVYIP